MSSKEQNKRRRQPAFLLILIPLFLLSFGFWVTFKVPVPINTPLPAKPITIAPEIELLGLTTRPVSQRYLYILPNWFVQATPPDYQVRWALTTGQGAVLSEVTAYPYFNTQRMVSWAAGLLVDDAYQLALPPGLPAGDYALQLQFLPPYPEQSSLPVLTVGNVTLPKMPLLTATEQQPLALFFGNEATVEGYTVARNGQPVSLPATETGGAETGGGYLVASPGDLVEYRLFWKAQHSITENYHSFLHLVDSQRQPLWQRDQLPGPFWSPPQLWDRFYAQPDVYRIPIPPVTANGLYYPRIGLYRFADQTRLEIFDSTGQDVGDGYDLPAIKIYHPLVANPQHSGSAHWPGLADLLGYDLQVAESGLQAASNVTITLYFRATGASQADYTRFVQLYNAEQGMAAQLDSPPQQGANPTAAWLAGEVVVDQVTLQIAPTAKLGAYQLQIGFYDPTTGVRVAVQDDMAQRLLDDQVILARLVIQ